MTIIEIALTIVSLCAATIAVVALAVALRSQIVFARLKMKRFDMLLSVQGENENPKERVSAQKDG